MTLTAFANIQGASPRHSSLASVFLSLGGGRRSA
ncbi:hypothetical protein WCLP8_2540002 [uncultured Gammaproteobacteria bacterium]